MKTGFIWVQFSKSKGLGGMFVQSKREVQVSCVFFRTKQLPRISHLRWALVHS